MKIYFFTFSKKYNSTARPTLTSGTSFDCVLKSDTGVIAPTIELNLGLVTNPSAYNFAYIPDFDRYYWVTEWDFVQSTWIASLSVDVLATWKPYIGDTSMYVYRSSYEYDGALKDDMYTTTSNVTYSEDSINILTPTADMEDGYYIVSVFGGDYDNDTPNNNMTYYVFDSDNFIKFMNKIYYTLNDNNLFGLIEVGLRNAIFDVSSYIKTCRWSPWNLGKTGSENKITTIDVGNIFITGIEAYPLDFNDDGTSEWASEVLTVPKHPQASTRGKYCNLAPYSRYRLFYYPFGVFEIDSVELVDFESLLLWVGVDALTGEGTLTVFAQNGTPLTPETYELHQLAVRTTKLLVDIPITFSNSNTAGFMQNMTYEAINQSYINKNATARLTALHYIQGVADLLIPTPSTVGNIGSLIELCYAFNKFQAIFLELADDDNESNGRPLCKVKLPKNIPGYIEGESNSFSAPATESEMAEVKRFIENGFYFE